MTVGAVRLCPTADVPAERGWPVRAGGVHVAVFAAGGEYHVLDNRCLHALATIDDGFVDDGCVVCPWHGWTFDLSSGEHLTVFGRRPGVRRYRSWVEDGWVVIDPDESASGTLDQ